MCGRVGIFENLKGVHWCWQAQDPLAVGKTRNHIIYTCALGLVQSHPVSMHCWKCYSTEVCIDYPILRVCVYSRCVLSFSKLFFFWVGMDTCFHRFYTHTNYAIVGVSSELWVIAPSPCNIHTLTTHTYSLCIGNTHLCEVRVVLEILFVHACFDFVVVVIIVVF